MRQIDRLRLLDRIGRELQSRMSYGDIDTYLSGFGVNTAKQTSGINSKWVYTKEILADVSPETIVRIADELGVPHQYAVTPSRDLTESRFWEPDYFRLFLSHLAVFKRTAGALQAALKRFGISAFVAHVDIEPTKEWQDEIEAALYSMDALAAILMPGFKESSWTDQEVGVAIGRGALIVPIIRGLDPYGFIGKFQGLNAKGKTVSQVAAEVFAILVTSPKTRSKMLSCLANVTARARSEADATHHLDVVENLSDLPTGFLEQLREGVLESSLFGGSGLLLSRVNALLAKSGLSTIASAQSANGGMPDEDEIPF